MSRDVAILGVGMHPWGKWGRNFAEYRMVFFGLAMVLIMVWRPQGLLSGRRRTATIRAQTDSVSKLRGLSESLTSTLKALRPIGSEASDRVTAQRQISQALATARSTGALPDAANLRDALSTIAKPSQDLFGSFTDYARDFYRTQLDIRDLSDIAGEQLDGAQAQLDATIAMKDALAKRDSLWFGWSGRTAAETGTEPTQARHDVLFLVQPALARRSERRTLSINDEIRLMFRSIGAGCVAVG